MRAAGDWAEMKDDATARSYFYNAKTGESTWVKPAQLEEAQQKQAAAKLASAKGEDGGEDGGGDDDEDDDGSDGSEAAWTRRRGRSTVVEALSGWECFKDPKTGKSFWWNAETKESTWDTPEARRTFSERSRTPEPWMNMECRCMSHS